MIACRGDFFVTVRITATKIVVSRISSAKRVELRGRVGSAAIGPGWLTVAATKSFDRISRIARDAAMPPMSWATT